MASAPTRFPFPPLLSSFNFYFNFNFKPTPTLLFRPPKLLRSLLCSSNSQSVLDDALGGFDPTRGSVPAVRTFENDLARLTLVGSVDFQQALTAAAADGGEAADEHTSSGIDAMVVETVFPGTFDDHSTVSTRLFLPAGKVKEKAMKLKGAYTKDIFEGTPSKNILAMTFRQVVLKRLLGLELVLFRPASERDMDDLENPREVPVFVTLNSSEERLISRIAEVVCHVVLENTERNFVRESTGRATDKMFGWFKKKKQVSSADGSVIMYNFLKDEILANAKMLLEKFDLERRKYNPKLSRLKNSYWTSPAFDKLEKIGGLEFCAWISECVPSYKLVIDASKFNEVKFDGWTKSMADTMEVLLTHSQMVTLSDILDMYYEDAFTLPSKRLQCSAVANSTNPAVSKGSSFLKIVSMVLAGGIFLVIISVLKKHHMPLLPNRSTYAEESSQSQPSDVNCVTDHSMDASKLETCCVSVIKRLKDSFDWTGEIRTKPGVCAWTGELPAYLREVDNIQSNGHEISSTPTPPESKEAEMKGLEEIANYQIVLSTDGNVIGFLPINQVAANNWAVNPLAKELHDGKNLSPGFLEPGLNISPPSDGETLLELLMSVNPDSYFALVRPVDRKG